MTWGLREDYDSMTVGPLKGCAFAGRHSRIFFPWKSEPFWGALAGESSTPYPNWLLLQKKKKSNRKVGVEAHPELPGPQAQAPFRPHYWDTRH